MEEIQPPKGNEAIGVHVLYISAAIAEIKSTLKEMQSNAVSRVEFDEHVIWGQDAVKDHELRLKSLEDENKGTMHQVAKALDKKLIFVIVALIFGASFLSMWMVIKYTNILDPTNVVITK